MKQSSTAILLAGLIGSNLAMAETTITLDSLTLSGLIELEAVYSKPETGEDSGDFVVATTEIGINAAINSLLTANITLLYEEGEGPFEVDISTLTLSPAESRWFITGGQQYLPFGLYSTHMISDPLTLEMGETRESALLFGVNQGGMNAAFFIFNGDEHEGSNLGISLSYDVEMAGFNIGYMDNLAESDGITDLVLSDKVAGMINSLYLNMGRISVNAEYLSSLEQFDATILAFNGKGAQPESWNIEFSYNTEAVSYALAYQGSDEAVELGLPESKILAVAEIHIAENTTLSFELAEEQDYSIENGGGSGEKTSTLSALLAAEF